MKQIDVKDSRNQIVYTFSRILASYWQYKDGVQVNVETKPPRVFAAKFTDGLFYVWEYADGRVISEKKIVTPSYADVKRFANLIWQTFFDHSPRKELQCQLCVPQ